MSKGKLSDLCPGSFARVALSDAVKNGLGQHVALCCCGKWVVLRCNYLKWLGKPESDIEGVVPKHNRGKRSPLPISSAPISEARRAA